MSRNVEYTPFLARDLLVFFNLLCLFFVKCASLCFSSFIFTDNSTMSAEVENILRSFWDWRLKESPEFATQIGVHTYDKSLDDHSLGAYAKRQVK